MTFFPLLKKVARSFYLTIRFLPQALQKPIALAYLLARASDTVADCARASINERENFLRLIERSLFENDPSLIQGVTNNFFFHFQEEEKELLQALPKLIQEINKSLESEAIKQMWKHILRGQLLDVTRNWTFLGALSSQELENYLYDVAGSVGEFWTLLAIEYNPYFSKASVVSMMASGRSYGKGLQLVNILRDYYEDQNNGRFYFQYDQQLELYQKALFYLKQGNIYVKNLQGGRFKYASVIPLLLAEETLKLIQQNSILPKVKMRRWKVYQILIQALPHLFF